MEPEKKKKPLQMSEEDKALLDSLCLMDDDFMSMVFDDNIPATQQMLRVILGRDDIAVQKVISQKNYKGTGVNLHSARLDILAEDSTGKVYDVEVQRSDAGAVPQRARFYSSMLDSRMLVKGEEYSAMKDTYVIFITENDVLECGLPKYTINRTIEETGAKFGDGAHIIYVNGQYRDIQDPIGRLMHDFHCTKAKDVLYSDLKSSFRHFKEEERGQEEMCRAWAIIEERGIAKGIEKGIAKGRAEGIAKGIEKGIAKGKNEGILGSVRMCRGMGLSDSDITIQLMKTYGLTLEEAEKFLHMEQSA